MKADKFWERLDTVLDDRKVKLIELASVCNISYYTLAGQKSKKRYPRADMIARMAHFLESGLNWLLGVDKEEFVLQTSLENKVRLMSRKLSRMEEDFSKMRKPGRKG